MDLIVEVKRLMSELETLASYIDDKGKLFNNVKELDDGVKFEYSVLQGVIMEAERVGHILIFLYGRYKIAQMEGLEDGMVEKLNKIVANAPDTAKVVEGKVVVNSEFLAALTEKFGK